MVTGHAMPAVLRNPLVRIVLVGIIAVIVLILILIVVVVSMRAAHNRPIDAAVYPNAHLVTKSATGQSDVQTYATADSVQDVLKFYDGWINKDDENGCKKIYHDTEASEEPGKVSGRCVISNSFLDSTQYLSIQIDYVSDGQTGKTIILIERSWGG
jgi:hypothetical protein